VKKEYIVDIIFFALAVIWCGVIFSFSAQKGEESGGLSKKVCYFIAESFVFDFDEMPKEKQTEIVEGMHLFVRKTAHFCVYAVLGFLVAMGLRRKKPLLRGALSEGFVVIYAAFDEIHQSFVSGRNGNIYDVILDSVGGLFGIVFAIVLWKTIRASREKRRRNNG